MSSRRFQSGTDDGHGKLAQAYGIGTTSWLVAVDADFRV